MKFESKDDSQMRAAGTVYGPANFGDQYNSFASQEITVSGVGEHPPNYETYWVDRSSYESQLRDRLGQYPVTQIVAEGGFGKSSLAAWAYERVTYEKRVWVSFRREQSRSKSTRLNSSHPSISRMPSSA